MSVFGNTWTHVAVSFDNVALTRWERLELDSGAGLALQPSLRRRPRLAGQIFYSSIGEIASARQAGTTVQRFSSLHERIVADST
jgi:hypothetical protein